MKRRSFFSPGHNGMRLQILGRVGNFLVIGRLFLNAGGSRWLIVNGGWGFFSSAPIAGNRFTGERTGAVPRQWGLDQGRGLGDDHIGSLLRRAAVGWQGGRRGSTLPAILGKRLPGKREGDGWPRAGFYRCARLDGRNVAGWHIVAR